MNEAQRPKLIPSIRVFSSESSIRLSQIVAGRRNKESENVGKLNRQQTECRPLRVTVKCWLTRDGASILICLMSLTARRYGVLDVAVV